MWKLFDILSLYLIWIWNERNDSWLWCLWRHSLLGFDGCHPRSWFEKLCHKEGAFLFTLQEWKYCVFRSIVSVILCASSPARPHCIVGRSGPTMAYEFLQAFQASIEGLSIDFQTNLWPFFHHMSADTLFWNAGNAINTWHIATHCIAMHAKQACFSPVFWSEWNECCLYFPAKEQKTKAADFFPETLHGCLSPRRSSTCSSTRRLQCTTMTYV